jgi:hypothetical protein
MGLLETWNRARILIEIVDTEKVTFPLKSYLFGPEKLTFRRTHHVLEFWLWPIRDSSGELGCIMYSIYSSSVLYLPSSGQQHSSTAPSSSAWYLPPLLSKILLITDFTLYWRLICAITTIRIVNTKTFCIGRTNLLSAGILDQSMGARNRVGIGLSHRAASYTGWRNRFLGIYSWAP